MEHDAQDYHERSLQLLREGLRAFSFYIMETIMTYQSFRKLWEQKVGPVPTDNEILFKDGNHLNCKFENLYYGKKSDA